MHGRLLAAPTVSWEIPAFPCFSSSSGLCLHAQPPRSLRSRRFGPSDWRRTRGLLNPIYSKPKIFLTFSWFIIKFFLFFELFISLISVVSIAFCGCSSQNSSRSARFCTFDSRGRSLQIYHYYIRWPGKNKEGLFLDEHI